MYPHHTASPDSSHPKPHTIPNFLPHDSFSIQRLSFSPLARFSAQESASLLRCDRVKSALSSHPVMLALSRHRSCRVPTIASLALVAKPLAKLSLNVPNHTLFPCQAVLPVHHRLAFRTTRCHVREGSAPQECEGWILVLFLR